MLKRNLFLCLFAMVLLTTSLAAQRSGRAGPEKMSGSEGLAAEEGFATEDEDTISLRDRCCSVIPPRRVLGRVLELSETQMETVGQLAQDISEAVGPLRDELRTLAMAFREEHGSDEPDATELGELLLAIKALQAEICVVSQSFAPDFVEILDDAQIEKWDAIKDRFCTSRRRRGPGRGGPGKKGENSDN